MADVETQLGGVLSCLAAWTLSSAAAMAENTAMGLLSRFSNVDGERTTTDGRGDSATRVSLGGRQVVDSDRAGTTAVRGED